VLCHDDLHQGNVLADRDRSGALQISGLLDLTNARAAEAVMDLTKCLFCAGHEDPRSHAPILTGYGAIEHPALDSALQLYTLLHRLHMWFHLRRLGSSGAAARSSLRLVFGGSAKRRRRSARASAWRAGSANAAATRRTSAASSLRTLTSTRTSPLRCMRARWRTREDFARGAMGCLRFRKTYRKRFAGQPWCWLR